WVATVASMTSRPRLSSTAIVVVAECTSIPIYLRSSIRCSLPPLEGMFCRSPKHTQTGAPFHNASHLPPRDMIGSISGHFRLKRRRSRREGLREPQSEETGRGGGPSTGARKRLALAKGAKNETNKSKFAKRTWNVPWNQQFNFWRLTSPSKIASAERGAHVAGF